MENTSQERSLVHAVCVIRLWVDWSGSRKWERSDVIVPVDEMFFNRRE